MDGRDTDPKSGNGFIEQVQECCSNNGAHIASIVDRFYAMDRESVGSVLRRLTTSWLRARASRLPIWYRLCRRATTRA